MLFPRAIIFDLDDTLLTAYRTPEKTWGAIIAEHAEALGEHDSRWVTAEVLARVLDFLAEEEHRKLWRLEGDETRRRVVRSAFHRLNLQRPPSSEPLHGVDADRIADRFESFLEETITLKPDAHEMLDALGALGIRLGLLTNGSGPRQRGKIARFDLARHFAAIQIEEEFGEGKPDPRVYEAILSDLESPAQDSWMIGDDPNWDIAAPKALGLATVFYSEDPTAPTPPEADARVASLSAILPLVRAAA
ncbi:HAD family hydrolase [Paracoccus aminophilus]|uniref:Hydrolase, HAD family n=1 Tax=Paracoccus aminophilus JCM 7686 TaxID=1367847 RepID=S5XPW7_PARAH|nr:HAD family hydrolase [Paracoccus aminophilus]AGT09399.1 hydrolase, HAD family [Paracoccus aminophilus JCM 7686]